MPRAKAPQLGRVTTKSSSVPKIFFIVVSSKVVMVTRLKCLRKCGNCEIQRDGAEGTELYHFWGGYNYLLFVHMHIRTDTHTYTHPQAGIHACKLAHMHVHIH